MAKLVQTSLLDPVPAVPVPVAQDAPSAAEVQSVPAVPDDRRVYASLEAFVAGR